MKGAMHLRRPTATNFTVVGLWWCMCALDARISPQASETPLHMPSASLKAAAADTSQKMIGDAGRAAILAESIR